MNHLEAIDATSSIGACWPPAPASYERIRGFYTEGVVDSHAAVQDFTEAFEETAASTLGDEYTRLSIRGLSTLAHVADIAQQGIEIEAAIPLQTDGEEPVLMFYAARNEADRAVTHEQTALHADLLRQVTSQGRQPRRQGNFDVTPSLVTVQTTEDQRRSITPQMAELYARFGYTAEDTEAILTNPENTIAILQLGSRVVSTAMAEKGSIDVTGFGPLHLMEITEAITDPAYRGNGLYQRVSKLLTQHVLEQHQSGELALHALYGESNMAMPGVLIAAHQNGRRFSHADRHALGIGDAGFGILRQNFSVDDGQELRPYNDFAVTYIPLGESRI